MLREVTAVVRTNHFEPVIKDIIRGYDGFPLADLKRVVETAEQSMKGGGQLPDEKRQEVIGVLLSQWEADLKGHEAFVRKRFTLRSYTA
jgi:hypothetical protein